MAQSGAEIPDDPQLDLQLTSAKYFVARGKVRNGAVVLEAKEDIKPRGSVENRPTGITSKPAK
jgi:hypothetical protein